MDKQKQGAEENLKNQQIAHAEALKQLRESLKNTKIDLEASNEKLTESFKDYKNSIAKLKAASTQRYSKIKKKHAKAVSVLSLLNEALYEGEPLVGSLLAWLAVGEKSKNNNKEEGEVTDDQDVLTEMDDMLFQKLFRGTADELKRIEEMRRELSVLSEVKEEADTLRVCVREVEERLVKAEVKF